MIRVGIVEDHHAIAEGLAALIGGEDDIEIAWIARDQQSASEFLADDPPDAVLCDVMLSGNDAGFDLLDDHGDRSRFVMYSAFDFPAHHARSLERGAAGFVSKVAPAEQIVAAIRKVHGGGRAFARDVLQSARQAARPPTVRELALIRLLVEGASNDEIAVAMSISLKTVEGWVRRMFDRYGCANRTQLSRFAMRQGWLTGR